PGGCPAELSACRRPPSPCACSSARSAGVSGAPGATSPRACPPGAGFSCASRSSQARQSRSPAGSDTASGARCRASTLSIHPRPYATPFSLVVEVFLEVPRNEARALGRRFLGPRDDGLLEHQVHEQD